MAASLFPSETTLPRLRSDLVISRQLYRGDASYVVKDPIGLRYYRIGEEEFFVASRLNGSTTIQGIAEEAGRKFPAGEMDEEAIGQIVSAFARMSFLELGGETAGRWFGGQLERKRQGRLKAIFGWLISSVFYLKVPLFDPDLVLLKLEKRMRFMWTKTAVAVLGLLVLAAIWVFGSNLERAENRLGDFLTLHNAGWLWLSFILVKVVHEFGHGLTCKHFGGEVHEMGAVFVIFTPFMYCDATDSWMFRHKWQKIAVNLGGIYFELFVAALATFLWAATQPGLANQIAFNVMVLCSVTTVLFNVNPLLRFDGYYVLSDWMEVPNLRERARTAVLKGMLRIFTGGPEEDESRNEDFLHKALFTLYAVGSYLYTWLIVYRIILVVGVKLEPMGLARWGQALEILTFGAGLVLPIYFFVRAIRVEIRKEENQMMRVRVFTMAGVAAAVLAVLAFLPWTVKVTTSCVLGGNEIKAVRARSPGFLRRILVREGDRVSRGQTLAVLEQDRLKDRLWDAEMRLQANAVLSQASLADEDAGAPARFASDQKELIAIKNRVAEDVAGLEIKAPFDGIIATPDIETYQGAMLREGDIFCEIIPQRRMHIVVSLNEQSAGLVKLNQPVEVKVYALPHVKFRGFVSKTFVEASERLPHAAFSSRFGGDYSTETDAQGRERPSQGFYQAELDVENTNELLRPGMSGSARILCGRSTLGKLAMTRVRQFLRLDLQL